jgi:hypothetical protein
MSMGGDKADLSRLAPGLPWSPIGMTKLHYNGGKGDGHGTQSAATEI